MYLVPASIRAIKAGIAGVGTVSAMSRVEGERSHGQGLVDAVACHCRERRGRVASLVFWWQMSL